MKCCTVVALCLIGLTAFAGSPQPETATVYAISDHERQSFMVDSLRDGRAVQSADHSLPITGHRDRRQARPTAETNVCAVQQAPQLRLTILL